MRTPTSREEIYRWHALALAGQRPPIHEDEPHAGYYLTRLVARGALVPGSIWLEQPTCPETGELIADEFYRAELLGEPQDPLDAWLNFAKRPICKLFYLQRLGELI